jgi:hypothetical protein
MSSPDLEKNIELWTKANAEYTDRTAREAWAKEEISWGIWGVRDSELDILGDVAGLDALELGCGTAYLSDSARPRRCTSRRPRPDAGAARDGQTHAGRVRA